jgi:hypothetical protein
LREQLEAARSEVTALQVAMRSTVTRQEFDNETAARAEAQRKLEISATEMREAMNRRNANETKLGAAEARISDLEAQVKELTEEKLALTACINDDYARETAAVRARDWTARASRLEVEAARKTTADAEVRAVAAEEAAAARAEAAEAEATRATAGAN